MTYKRVFIFTIHNESIVYVFTFASIVFEPTFPDRQS